MKRILLGMSGGVDSSVAAAILVEQGYEVIGAFMKNWEGDECNWADESADAMIVAEQLGIPFRVIDFQTQYKDLIIDYLVKEYKAGRTPNPDVYCNRLMKFGVFWEAFHKLSIDYIATGHYATTDQEYLYKGVDPTKDQSYFLSNVTKEQISRMILPLGEYHKSEIREMASNYNLHVADKKDSQGICFIGKIPFDDFISRYIPDNPGDIVDFISGQKIGSHRGLHFYTIGQRKRLNVNQVGPWFVHSLDKKSNTVFIVHESHKDYLYKDKFKVINCTWHDPMRYRQLDVVVRYHDRPFRVVLDNYTDNTVEATFIAEQGLLAPGQIAVFYDGNRLIGSGTIIGI